MEWTNKWNPFNSFKTLCHHDHFKNIHAGINKFPLHVSIDPSNLCNLKCAWCNADYILSQRNNLLSINAIFKIIELMKFWKVPAICIGGGGEPLTNPNTGLLINYLINNGSEVGLITNGILLDKIENNILSKCTYIGISVDSGNKEIFKKLKGVDQFDRVIKNIHELNLYLKDTDCKLKKFGVTYKYLIYKDNINTMYDAAKIAKEIGCTGIQFRPASTPYDKIGTDDIIFSDIELSDIKDNTFKCLNDLNDKSFSVYGVTHKFNDKLEKANNFSTCYSSLVAPVIMPGKENEDNFIFGFCCDRRGDEKLELPESYSNDDIINFWGSEKHYDMLKKININECPRCTMTILNQIFDNVILEDNMNIRFI